MLASRAPGCSVHYNLSRPGQHRQHAAPANLSVGRWGRISFRPRACLSHARLCSKRVAARSIWAGRLAGTSFHALRRPKLPSSRSVSCSRSWRRPRCRGRTLLRWRPLWSSGRQRTLSCSSSGRPPSRAMQSCAASTAQQSSSSCTCRSSMPTCSSRGLPRSRWQQVGACLTFDLLRLVMAGR